MCYRGGDLTSKVLSEDDRFQPVMQRWELLTPLFFPPWASRQELSFLVG